MNSYKYYVADVFTDDKYKGNPLAVVMTDSDLDLITYQNISREFGYSETSFIYYSKMDKALKVRSFTPTGFEVNGAGHNLLGAVCVALLVKLEIFHEQGRSTFVMMKDELTELEIRYSEENLPFIGMRQSPAEILSSVPPKVLSKALNLDEVLILTAGLYPVVVKTEVAHLMVPLKNVQVLNSIVPDKKLLIQASEEFGFEGVYCFTIPDNDPNNLAHARFFNPGIGIDEDPATGSAAGPLAGLLFHQNYIKQGIVYNLLQGEKLSRPSAIQFEVKPDSIWVSGSSVIVMEGTLYT